MQYLGWRWRIQGHALTWVTVAGFNAAGSPSCRGLAQQWGGDIRFKKTSKSETPTHYWYYYASNATTVQLPFQK
jgi:hypothetical protein